MLPNIAVEDQCECKGALVVSLQHSLGSDAFGRASDTPVEIVGRVAELILKYICARGIEGLSRCRISIMF